MAEVSAEESPLSSPDGGSEERGGVEPLPEGGPTRAFARIPFALWPPVSSSWAFFVFSFEGFPRLSWSSEDFGFFPSLSNPVETAAGGG